MGLGLVNRLVRLATGSRGGGWVSVTGDDMLLGIKVVMCMKLAKNGIQQ